MSRRARATIGALLATATVGAPLAALPVAAQAAQIKSGFYDCWGYQGTFFTYYGTYEFKTPGHYLYAADRKGHHLVGKVKGGTYKLRGKKLTPTSGPMKRNHLFMVKKNVNEWILGNPNHLAIGCYRLK